MIFKVFDNDNVNSVKKNIRNNISILMLSKNSGEIITSSNNFHNLIVNGDQPS